MSFNDEVDGWISQLMQCKPLSEAEVKKLCDKVSEGLRALFLARLVLQRGDVEPKRAG